MTEFVIAYWWAIMAIGVSPLFGYAVAQRVKAVRPKPSNAVIINAAGLSTTISAFGFWMEYSGVLSQSIMMAVTIGMMQLLMVRAIFGLMERFFPKVAKRIEEGTDDTSTILPWKNKSNDD